MCGRATRLFAWNEVWPFDDEYRVRLEGLEPISAQLPLFGGEAKRRSLMDAIDAINRKAGADAVYLASMHGERDTAPRRIPFGQPPDLALPDHD